VAKENGLQLEIVEQNPMKGVSSDYTRVNQLGKIPSFEGADGFILSECLAIAVYSMLPLSHLHSAHARVPRNDEQFLLFLYSYPCQKTNVDFQPLSYQYSSFSIVSAVAFPN